MTRQHFTLGLLVCGLAGIGFGCGKSEDAKPETKGKTESAITTGTTEQSKKAESAAAEAKQAADKAAATASEAAKKAADAAQATASQAAQAAKEQAAAAKVETPAPASDVSAKVQPILDGAKKLIAEGKWDEATKSLESLTGLKLTSDQQSLVDQLKQQIKQLQGGSQKVTGEATKSLGNLLKK